jgi:hypothetical protein
MIVMKHDKNRIDLSQWNFDLDFIGKKKTKKVLAEITETLQMEFDGKGSGLGIVAELPWAYCDGIDGGPYAMITPLTIHVRVPLGTDGDTDLVYSMTLDDLLADFAQLGSPGDVTAMRDALLAAAANLDKVTEAIKEGERRDKEEDERLGPP